MRTAYPAPLSFVIALSLATVALSIPSPAAAQPGSDADSARQLASSGVAAYRAGRFREAVELLEQAETRFHAPTHLYYIGASKEALGDSMGAFDAYSSLVAEELPNYAPDAFGKARAQAAEGLERVARTVAAIEIRMPGPLPEGGAVMLDGVGLRVSQLSRRIPVAPGKHSIALTVPGLLPASREPVATVGQNTVVELAFVPASGPRGGAPGSDRGSDPANGNANRMGFAPAIVTFSLSGAALVAGAVTGGLTLAKAKEIESHCDPNGHCPVEYADDADTARTLGIVSTAAFAVAGAGIVTGIVLAVAGAPRRDSAAALTVGPGFVGVRGAF